MALKLTILYRGPLASCNYDCGYCPFAKRRDSAEQLESDRRALQRFVDWVVARPTDDEIRVFFTPWGEALVREWYRQAFITLTAAPQVRKVAVQTNLSCRLNWLGSCDLNRVGLWCTYHPEQVSRERFLHQCRELDRRGVSYSVGLVGMKHLIAEAEQLRRELSSDVYLWINAYKRVPGYYTDDEIAQLTQIDPLFGINNQRHVSLGNRCLTGETVVSVDGEGVMRRCHFIDQPIGNLYTSDLAIVLQPRPCTKASCGCHIGYVHMPRLKLYELFTEGLLERALPAHLLNDHQQRP